MSRSTGFISLDRRILNHWVSEEPETMAVFVRMLLEASWEAKEKVMNGRLVALKRGQLLFGRSAFSGRCGVSEGKLRRILKLLETDGMIDQQKTNKYSIISITNYDSYQLGNQQIASRQPANQPANSQQDDENSTSKSPAEKPIEIEGCKDPGSSTNQQIASKPASKQPATQPHTNKLRSKENKKTPLPTFVDKDLFGEFSKMRTRIKKPLTDQARTRLINRMKKFNSDGLDVNAMLEKSCDRCWSDIFPPDDYNPELKAAEAEAGTHAWADKQAEELGLEKFKGWGVESVDDYCARIMAHCKNSGQEALL